MARRTLVRIHLIASLIAVITVASFALATIFVEALDDESAIRAVKHGILIGLGVLVPAMAAAAITGRHLAGRSRAEVVLRKLRRMRIIGITGALILIPSAITLDRLAAAGEFTPTFGIIQAVELVAGASNLTLLVLNFRDGRALGAKRRARAIKLRNAPAPGGSR